MKKTYTLIIFSLFSFVPLITFGNMAWFTGGFQQFARYSEYVTDALAAIAFILFVWGVVKFLMSSGDEKTITEGKKFMVWGVVTLFILVSVWGLVGLLQQLTGIPRANPLDAPGVTI